MWCGVRGRREELDKTYRSPTLHPSPRSYTLNKYFRRHADLRVRRNLLAIYAVLLPSCFETYYRALRCVFMTFITRGEMSTFVPRKTVVGTPSARPPPLTPAQRRSPESRTTANTVNRYWIISRLMKYNGVSAKSFSEPLLRLLMRSFTRGPVRFFGVTDDRIEKKKTNTNGPAYRRRHAIDGAEIIFPSS